jgi:hypothetical protein
MKENAKIKNNNEKVLKDEKPKVLKNKTLIMDVIPRVVESITTVYSTGGASTEKTQRRIRIFEFISGKFILLYYT